MHTKQFAAGDVIFRQGDESDEAYQILSGQVSISIESGGRAQIVADLDEGEIFGEMGMVDEMPRAATATARVPTLLAVISNESFGEVIGDPDVCRLYIGALYERLRTTASMLQGALSSSAPHATLEATLLPETPSAATSPDAATLTLESAPGTPTAVEGPVNTTITKFPFRIGRDAGDKNAFAFLPNDLLLRDSEPYHVSRVHCMIERRGNRFAIRDMGSRLGTLVDGVSLGGKSNAIIAELPPGQHDLVIGAENSPHRYRLAVA